MKCSAKPSPSMSRHDPKVTRLCSGSVPRRLSPSPQPSPAGRGSQPARARRGGASLKLVRGRSIPLSQRERAGVRANACFTRSRQLSPSAPLISTGLQPGVGACERESRFNGFSCVPQFPRRAETVETVSASPAHNTRLKPGANETTVSTPKPRFVGTAFHFRTF